MCRIRARALNTLRTKKNRTSAYNIGHIGTTTSTCIHTTIYININTFLEENVLHRLWQEDKVQTSDFVISHLSDVLRYALIFKFGGTYVDTDVIFLKPLPKEEFLPNFIGKENEELPHLGEKIFTKIRAPKCYIFILIYKYSIKSLMTLP